MANEVLVYIT